VRRRLLLSYLSLTLFVLLALEVPLGVSFANAEHRRLESQVQTEAFALALQVDEPLSPLTTTSALSGSTRPDIPALTSLVRMFHRRTGREVTIIGSDGRVVATAGHDGAAVGNDARSASDLANALHGRTVTGTRRVGSHDLLSASVPVLAGNRAVGAVRVSSSQAVVGERTRENWLLLAGLGGVVALVVLLVSVLLARSFTRPLAALDAGAARLGRGDLATRVPVPDDPPELRGLAESFNATAAQLEELVRSQQAFIADASHQLRTPLAALSLRLENLEAEGRRFRVDDVQGARTEVRRLGQLVDGLLVLARAEHASGATTLVDVPAVVAGRVDAWNALADERGVHLVVEMDDALARSVPGRLEQVLDNLLSNALDVAPPGTSVTIEVDSTRDRVLVSVRDEGPGMSPEQRARAFDRFWRATPSRREQGGFGLGLAIVRRLVMADGGEVVLDDSPGGGLRVVVRLPVAEAGVLARV
jgi:signal transduction histidine kinase